MITVSRRLVLLVGFTVLTGAVTGAGSPKDKVLAPTTLKLPLKDGSIRFAVIGDTGRGNRGQIEVGKQMEAVHREFPFNFVIMLGDNIYGSDTPADMVRKFSGPYKALRELKPGGKVKKETAGKGKK